MAEFLTDAWVDALAAAAATVVVDAEVSLSVCQVVDGCSWTVRVDGGRITVDRSGDADLTITTDRATAAAMATGELAAQDALAAGRLRLGGDLGALLRGGPALAGVDAAMAAVRATTTY